VVIVIALMVCCSKLCEVSVMGVIAVKVCWS